MDDQTPEERFNAFLEQDAERWRCHEAEIAALKLTISELVISLEGARGKSQQVARDLSVAAAKLGPEAHPAGLSLLRDICHALEVSAQVPTVDGRPPGYGTMK